jgi:hypothetical protein
MHGSRDYYYLIKYIVHHMRANADSKFIFTGNLIKTATLGIARNFGGSETSYSTFLTLFKNKLIADNYQAKYT